MSRFDLGEFGKALDANAGEYSVTKNTDGTFTLTSITGGSGNGFVLVDNLTDLNIIGGGTTTNELGTHVRVNADGRGYIGNSNNFSQVDGQTSYRLERIDDTNIDRRWRQLPVYFTGGTRRT